MLPNTEDTEAFPLLIFMTWIPKETFGPNGGWVGVPFLLLLYLISDSLILCNLWHMAGLQEETKWNQRKYGRRRKWSHWSPSVEAKKYIIKPRLKLWLKKKKFLTLITQLGWFVNMVISITFRLEGRISRWNLINSEKLLICLPKRKKSQSYFTKEFLCTI